MLLSDTEIAKLCQGDRPMIKPFDSAMMTPGVVSWGVGSYGYDLRLGRQFRVFEPPMKLTGRVIDPKREEWHEGFTRYEDRDYVLIPPNSFALGVSLEVMDVPRHLLAVCLGKSTYARCGLIVNVTPLEPEWRGKVTIEISNTTPLPARLHAGEGICQVIFLKSSQVCARSYADKKGIYQNQTELTVPKCR